MLLCLCPVGCLSLAGGQKMQHMRLINPSNESLWILLSNGGQFWPPDSTRGQKPVHDRRVKTLVQLGLN